MKADAEFRAMLGELSPIETLALKESIELEGVREQATLWSQWVCPECGEVAAPRYDPDGSIGCGVYCCGNCGYEMSDDQYHLAESTAVLVDGYNRAKIAKELDTDLPVRFMVFQDRAAVKAWIARNQLGRRNIGPDKAAYCRGILYREVKQDIGENQHTRVAQNEPPSGTTAAKIAKEFGVSPATIKRDGQFAESVDALEEIEPGTREKALSGEIPRAQVVDAGKSLKNGNTDEAKRKLSPEERQELNRRADESAARRERESSLVVPVRTLLEVLMAIDKHIEALPDDTRRVESLHEIIKVCRAKSVEIQQGRLV